MASVDRPAFFVFLIWLEEIVLKRKTLLDLGKELQRQRLNRQDSNFYGAMLNLSVERKSLSFTVSETALDNLKLCAAVLPVIQDEPLVFRLICKNGLICKDLAQKKYHVGRQVNASDDSAYELYSEATLAQDDKTFFLKVQDIFRATGLSTQWQPPARLPRHMKEQRTLSVLAIKFLPCPCRRIYWFRRPSPPMMTWIRRFISMIRTRLRPSTWLSIRSKFAFWQNICR